VMASGCRYISSTAAAAAIEDKIRSAAPFANVKMSPEPEVIMASSYKNCLRWLLFCSQFGKEILRQGPAIVCAQEHTFELAAPRGVGVKLLTNQLAALSLAKVIYNGITSMIDQRWSALPG
jgi:hypothetical protein